MTEKLGVLLLELPNSWFRYILLMKSVPPLDKSTIMETDDKEDVVEYAYKCTQEEAQKYPQFRWVALEELK
ncbi:TPA: hypothetical protein TY768_000912 [Streptococcus suis]|nr:hypothetical protein [Streptococcus suis]